MQVRYVRENLEDLMLLVSGGSDAAQRFDQIIEKVVRFHALHDSDPRCCWLSAPMHTV